MTTDAADDCLVAPRDGAAHRQRQQGVRHRVDGILDALPAGHVVLRDLALPRPSRATVHHLVVAPRSIWAITTLAFDEPVVVGHGRNDDTLFAGRRPLRAELEAADWEADAVSAAIGHVVEPLIVVAAPGLPAPQFDFHGIRIADPAALADVVTTPTATFVDVADVARVVERRFGVRPSGATAMPTLGSAVLPPSLRPGHAKRRRRPTRVRLPRRRRTIVRSLVLVALAVAAVVAVPAVRAIWDTAVDEGTDLVTGESRPETDEPVSVSPVGTTFACPSPGSAGSAWRLAFRWPGPLPEGASSYGVRTEAEGAPPLVHAAAPWTDPFDPPPPIDVTWDGPTTVHTDLRGPDGTVIATATAVVAPPVGDC